MIHDMDRSFQIVNSLNALKSGQQELWNKLSRIERKIDYLLSHAGVLDDFNAAEEALSVGERAPRP